jgi:GntR family transcriptional regulator, vanillate catabolism transcriptional regulator
MNVPRISDMPDTIEVRGAVEGLAARFAAERGVTVAQLAPAQAHLAAIDRLLEQCGIDVGSFLRYIHLNTQFHNSLIALADCPLLSRHIGHDVAVPIAPSLGTSIASGMIRPILVIEQVQHRAILETIEAGEGGRAEAIVRDHARLAQRNLTRLGARTGVAGAG